MQIEHELYLRLRDQAHAVATYLIEHELAPGPCVTPHGDSDDDRDVLERAADHVTALAGYQGVDAHYVSDMLWRGLRDKMRVPERYQLSLTE